jgi:hypothetical protein
MALANFIRLQSGKPGSVPIQRIATLSYFLIRNYCYIRITDRSDSFHILKWSRLFGEVIRLSLKKPKKRAKM